MTAKQFDRLISATEQQNQALDKVLQLLFSIAESLTQEKREKQLLLEKHPPPRQTPSETAAQAANIYNDNFRYGNETEEPPPPTPQPARPAPPPQQSVETVAPLTQSLENPPPPVPYTSKAEMMEQAERKN